MSRTRKIFGDPRKYGLYVGPDPIKRKASEIAANIVASAQDAKIKDAERQAFLDKVRPALEDDPKFKREAVLADNVGSGDNPYLKVWTSSMPGGLPVEPSYPQASPESLSTKDTIAIHI